MASMRQGPGGLPIARLMMIDIVLQLAEVEDGF